MNQSTVPNAARYDWPALAGRLFRLLRLKTTPIGIKLFEKKEQLTSIDRIRVARDTLTACQIIGQAARLNWTVGATLASLNPGTCGVVLGFSPRDDEWLSGKSNVGVWLKTIDDSAMHQRVLPGVPHGRFEARVGIHGAVRWPAGSRVSRYRVYPSVVTAESPMKNC